MNGFEYVMDNCPEQLFPLCKFLNPSSGMRTFVCNFLRDIRDIDAQKLIELMENEKPEIIRHSERDLADEEGPKDL